MLDVHPPLAAFVSVAKDYGNKRAVSDLSFHVQAGEIVGLLGPNGAGKSTSMKMLTGFIQATSGDIRVLDCDPGTDPESTQKHVGYLPESTPLYAEWTVDEFLKFSARSRNISRVQDAVNFASERSGLNEVRKQLIGTLSKGYRQRTCFAQSIIHDPSLLVLDEPTDGLDPNQKASMQAFIREMGKDKGILFSTHILSEAEAMCDRVLVLDRGMLVHDGDVASLKQRGQLRRQIRLQLSGVSADAFRACYSQLKEIETITVLSDAPHETAALLSLSAALSEQDAEALSLSIAAEAVKQKWPIIELKQEVSTISEAFASLTNN
ncbi:ABC transporter ATP-binding protein [Coraliomargarita akajimensis]|uniref:ABC transporter related protein n=1 Tax=Coraliomargarita akajimensis (strain DSM 45221 / IAM 15411 / JCM 23193 / KCTC 12865 / 04OKA010-24) TaxID=583355 RepID=D5EN57_CORAD|nr:ABC transporter ATP-binding protein [Coraliomargarita akajimensis]ADE53492.1 ABC transporter related protein [Coraliomargarita akajimensis DSM 45221]